MKYLPALQGLLIGIVLILFRAKISVFVQKSFEKLPKYQDGVKTFNMNFEVQPSNIVAVGCLFIFVAALGILVIYKA